MRTNQRTKKQWTENLGFCGHEWTSWWTLELARGWSAIIVRVSWHIWPWGYRKSISTILEHYIHMYIYILKNLFLKFLEKYLIIGYRSYVEDKKWCLPNNGQKRGTRIKFGNGLIGRRNESTDIDQILSVYSSRIVDPESCEPDKKYLPRYRRSLSRWQELDLIGLAGQMTCNKS